MGGAICCCTDRGDKANRHCTFKKSCDRFSGYKHTALDKSDCDKSDDVPDYVNPKTHACCCTKHSKKALEPPEPPEGDRLTSAEEDPTPDAPEAQTHCRWK